MPRKLSTGAGAITVEQFVDDMLEDVSPDGSIFPAKRDEIVEAIQATATKSKSKGKESGDPFIAKLAAEYQADEDDKKRKAEGNDDEAEPKAKKKKKKNENDHERALELYAKYKKSSVEELKDILRWNHQTLTGKKDNLLHKVCRSV